MTVQEQVESHMWELGDKQLNGLALHFKLNPKEGLQTPLGVTVTQRQRENFIRWVKKTGNVEKAGIYLGILPDPELPARQCEPERQSRLDKAAIDQAKAAKSQIKIAWLALLVSIVAIIISIVVKGENMWYGLFLLIAIPLIVWIEFNARQRREDTRQKAHEKVIELHQRGIWAEVCPRCEGKARVGIITHDCDKCGGIGYLYDLSEKALGEREDHQEKHG